MDETMLLNLNSDENIKPVDILDTDVKNSDKKNVEKVATHDNYWPDAKNKKE